MTNKSKKTKKVDTLQAIPSPISNAYPDEQKNLNQEFEEELTTWLQIVDVCKSRGFKLEPQLVDGLPEVVLVRA